MDFITHCACSALLKSFLVLHLQSFYILLKVDGLIQTLKFFFLAIQTFLNQFPRLIPS
jgi:hypothetical protein